MLSESVLSFNTIHDRVRHCETGGLRDGTGLGDELAAKASTSDRRALRAIFGMLPSSPIPFDPVIGERKFGPYQVVVKNFLRNIRITTFFAGESEVKIIDPSRISEVQGFGCKVEFIPPTESIL